jgi:hypothetical protein
MVRDATRRRTQGGHHQIRSMLELRTFAIGAAILVGSPLAGPAGPSCADQLTPCAIAFAAPATGAAGVTAVALKQAAPTPATDPQRATPGSPVHPLGAAEGAADDAEAAFLDESAAAQAEAGRGLVAWLLILAALAGAGLLAYRYLPALQDAGVPGNLRSLRQVRGARDLRSLLRGRQRQRTLPPLFVPPGLAAAARGEAPARSRPRPAVQANVGSSAAPQAPQVPAAPRKPTQLFRYPTSAAPQLAVVTGAGTAGPGSARAAGAGSAAALVSVEPESEEVQLGRVHFHRPPEGTLQLLPGRLEIVGGTDREDEIRFVRVPGREPVVTFGRSDGEPHTHVRLNALTVSRVHAAMRFQGGNWYIENRSTTNPVTVNGAPLPLAGGPAVKLADGDTMELGEVIFRYRLR